MTIVTRRDGEEVASAHFFTLAREGRRDSQGPNPPVLHRKEAFLLPDDPRRPKFDRLTRQEERAGLPDDTATIGTRAGWADRLRERGYALRGHRLVRRRAGDGPAGTRPDDRSE